MIDRPQSYGVYVLLTILLGAYTSQWCNCSWWRMVIELSVTLFFVVSSYFCFIACVPVVWVHHQTHSNPTLHPKKQIYGSSWHRAHTHSIANEFICAAEHIDMLLAIGINSHISVVGSYYSHLSMMDVLDKFRSFPNIHIMHMHHMTHQSKHIHIASK